LLLQIEIARERLLDECPIGMFASNLYATQAIALQLDRLAEINARCRKSLISALAKAFDRLLASCFAIGV